MYSIDGQDELKAKLVKLESMLFGDCSGSVFVDTGCGIRLGKGRVVITQPIVFPLDVQHGIEISGGGSVSFNTTQPSTGIEVIGTREPKMIKIWSGDKPLGVSLISMLVTIIFANAVAIVNMLT